AEMLPSGWVTPSRAPGVKSFQSKSGLVRVLSSRNLLSGWYQPAFQKRFFSTCSEVKKASIPPEFAVISTVIFCRAWISGSVSHFTFMPESDSNSGMFFSSTSMNGCLVSSRKSSLPWKRFQSKLCARAGVDTNGPAATPVARPCKKVRRVSRRAAIRDLLSITGDIAGGGLMPGDTVAPFRSRLKRGSRSAILRAGARDRRRDRAARTTMRYRAFGRTGLRVSVLGFGCWPMAGDRYGAINDDEAIKAIHRALDRGVNCVDTAPAYGGGHSEEVVARALEKTRRDVVLVAQAIAN